MAGTAQNSGTTQDLTGCGEQRAATSLPTGQVPSGPCLSIPN